MIKLSEQEAKGIALMAEICIKAHATQFDKGGLPHWFHCMEVAVTQTTYDRMALALFHDLKEDQPHIFHQIEQAEISDPTPSLSKLLWRVDMLTRRPNEPYPDYIQRVAECGDLDVIEVKITDVSVNANRSRDPCSPKHHNYSRWCNALVCLIAAREKLLPTSIPITHGDIELPA